MHLVEMKGSESGRWIIIYIAFIKDQIMFKEVLKSKLIRK